MDSFNFFKKNKFNNSKNTFFKNDRLLHKCKKQRERIFGDLKKYMQANMCDYKYQMTNYYF